MRCNLKTACVDIKNAVRFLLYDTLGPKSFSWETPEFCSNREPCWLTVHVAQVEVSIDQWGSVVEVLGHVIQPVGLHAFDTLVTVLNLKRHLDSVVLHLALSNGRMVVQSEQFHPLRDTTENKNLVIDLTQ